jgi:hypothetical protein
MFQYRKDLQIVPEHYVSRFGNGVLRIGKELELGQQTAAFMVFSLGALMLS